MLHSIGRRFFLYCIPLFTSTLPLLLREPVFSTFLFLATVILFHASLSSFPYISNFYFHSSFPYIHSHHDLSPPMYYKLSFILSSISPFFVHLLIRFPHYGQFLILFKCSRFYMHFSPCPCQAFLLFAHARLSYSSNSKLTFLKRNETSFSLSLIPSLFPLTKSLPCSLYIQLSTLFHWSGSFPFL